MDLPPSTSKSGYPTHSYSLRSLQRKRQNPSPEEMNNQASKRPAREIMPSQNTINSDDQANTFSCYVRLSNFEAQINQFSPILGQERSDSSHLTAAGLQERILQVRMDISGQQNRLQQLQMNLLRQTDTNIVPQSNLPQLPDRLRQLQLEEIPARTNNLQRDLQRTQQQDEIPMEHIPVRLPSEEQAESNYQLQLNIAEISPRSNQQQLNPQTTQPLFQNHQPEVPDGQNQFRLSTEGIAGRSNHQQLDFQELSVPNNPQQGHASANGQLVNPLGLNRPIRFRHATEAVAEEELDNIKCGICLTTAREYQQNRRPVARTVCGHFFCIPCIYKWKKQSLNCPLCRRVVLQLSGARGFSIFHVI